MARPSIWGLCDGDRVQGVLTRIGSEALEWRRQELAALYERVMGRAPSSISDAATIEFALRGVDEAVRRLRALRQEGGA